MAAADAHCIFLRGPRVSSRGARRAQLLLHAKEIRHLERAVLREGYTLVPLNLYFKEGRVKVTLGLGRGKKAHDKRAAIAAKDRGPRGSRSDPRATTRSRLGETQ